MRGLGLTKGSEARVLKRKPRATHGERRRVPRKTGDGASRDSGGGTVGVERIGSEGKPESLPLFRTMQRAIFKKTFQTLSTCTTVLLYEYRHFRRSPWEKRLGKNLKFYLPIRCIKRVEETVLWRENFRGIDIYWAIAPSFFGVHSRLRSSSTRN